MRRQLNKYGDRKMKKALIINFSGKNLVGTFSITEDNHLKLEETIIDFEHNSPIPNIYFLEKFNTISCQGHNYEQFAIGIGRNYRILFLDEKEAEDIINYIREEKTAYCEKETEEKEKAEKAQQDKISLAFAKAKETGIPQELSRYSYETAGKYVQVVNEITYAMPDGTKKNNERRNALNNGKIGIHLK